MFVNVKLRLAEEPRAMLPKLRLAGEACNPVCVPTPVTTALIGSVESDVETPMTPGRVPVVGGAKVTWIVQLVPEESVPPWAGQSLVVL